MPFQTRTVDYGGERNYQVFIPENTPDPLPAILFLHGMGESGNDGRQAEVGIAPAIRANPERWPFLVVLPQKLDAAVLWTYYLDMLNRILEDVDDAFITDPSRRYLTGLSQGGNGTLELANRLRWKFAAIAPICGWRDPRAAALDLIDKPIWMFHGDADQAVAASCSQAVADILRLRGSEPEFTVYPGVGHNSWDLAYQESDLPNWLLNWQLLS